MGVIVFCPNSYTVGKYGLGGFLNPDYQGVGDYSAVNSLTGTGTYLGNWSTGLTVSRGDIVYNAGADQKFYINLTGTNGSTNPDTDPTNWTLVNMGIWTSSLTPVINNVVIWNGLQWVNLTDVNTGTSPDMDPTNWLQLNKDIDNVGYIEEWDIIEYDFGNDWLDYRADKRGNQFSYSYLTGYYYGSGFSAIPQFQWGNDKCFDNKVNEGELSQINSLGYIYSNVLGQAASIGSNYLSDTSDMTGNVLDASSSIFGNELDEGASISFNQLGAQAAIWGNTLNMDSSIDDNVLSPNTTIYFNALMMGSVILNSTFNSSADLAYKTLDAGIFFDNNTVGVNIDTVETYTSLIASKRAESGFSNFETSLSVASSAINVAAVGYCGIINITGSSATINTITSIGSLGGIQYFRIKPDTGVTVTFNSTFATNIILLGRSLGTVIITLNGSNNDYIDFWTDGTNAYQNSPANNF